MEDDEEDASYYYYYLKPKPTDWVDSILCFQADLIHNCLLFLFSPVLFFFSMVSESYRRANEVAETIETTVQKVPSTISNGIVLLLKKLGFGFLGAAYVCMVLVAVFVLAAVVGVGLVQLWVEEPVFVRERLHFDYTQPHPKALFSFCGGFEGFQGSLKKKKQMGVPVGQTYSVSLHLLLPESGFNRDIGVFQISSEVISTNGDVIERSTQPCMLRFRSLPVRLARTALFGVPLVLGITGETQRITIDILKHREGQPRTGAIRVNLNPRAGTWSLPQLYEAEIIINSKLPWTKNLVHGWKWTFYVWSALNTYIVFLTFLVLFCKPLLFPLVNVSLSEQSERNLAIEPPTREPEARAQVMEEDEDEEEEEEEVGEFLRRWRESRRKRKAIYLQERLMPEAVGSSASTISITREETSDFGDSESVCLGG